MTIFQKIINRELPANIVYEDERVIAILDISPVTTGHTLVIPKEFSRNLKDISKDDLSYVMNKAQDIALKLIEILDVDGFQLHVNNEKSSNQVVFHTHVHIIPTQTKKEIKKEDIKISL
ncbi:MAG: HIT family protein [Mycoplasmatales bacterium]|nr:HIT family protein [Mycoplasmatales bacterium]